MNKIKQKTYLNLLALFSVMVGLFYVGDFYLVKAVKNSSAEIVEKKQEIERLKEQNSQINSIRTGYKHMQKEMDEISNLTVDYSDIIKFIIEIENIAKENEVNLNINVSDKEGESLSGNLSSVGYNLKASGDFNGLMRFLIHLENLKYYNDIESINMFYDNKNKGGADGLDEINPNNIVLNVGLTVYVKNKNNK